jgi:hypothetical protein
LSECSGYGPPEKDEEVYVDLYVIAPDLHPTFGREWNSTDPNKKHYAATEQEVLSPGLEKLGYTLRTKWFTGDGDSFGPLTRCIKVEKDGVRVTVVYG